MEVILCADPAANRRAYAGIASREFAAAWRSRGHAVIAFPPRRRAGHPRSTTQAELLQEARQLLLRAPEARVHLTTTGPAAIAMAQACAELGRRYTSASEITELKTHQRGLFGDAIRLIHAGAARVVTPVSAASELLGASGIHSAITIAAGVDTQLFQPRVYGKLDLPRPVTLLLAADLASTELRQFIERSLPGTRMAYVPEWTGGPMDSALRIVGYLPPAELAELISAADVCVVPEQGISSLLLCLQALACGVPVASPGNRYLQSLLVTEGIGSADPNLSKAVAESLAGNRQLCRQVAQRHAWHIAAQQILDLLSHGAEHRVYVEREVAA